MKHGKLIFTVIAAAALAGAAALSGCTVSIGTDGRDGQDVSIREIFEETNAARLEQGLDELTFLEFVSQYLSYDGTEAEQMTSLQAAINRSLLSSVQVTADFGSEGVATGSGVIIQADREAGDMYVVTNCHVVCMRNEVSDDVHVFIYGREYSMVESGGETFINSASIDQYGIEAEVIGSSYTYDVAVLKVTGSSAVRSSDILAAEWSTDENVYVGASVYAIGNAASGGISATNGIICVDSEDITIDMYDTPSNYSDDFTYRTIRTSVPIYSGNSGGGLFNSEGELVGLINSKTVVASDGEYSDNISHALPGANVRRAARSMIDAYERTGRASRGVVRAMLGVTVELQSSEAYMNNQTGLVEIVDHCVVREVSSSSIAYGKVEAGDAITHITISDGEGVKEDADVTRLYNVSEIMLSAREGDSVAITVERRGEGDPVTYTMQVTSSCFTTYN